MIARFFCPYCRASLDPAALDVGCSEHIDLRICPVCDTPVLFGHRDIQVKSVTGEPDAGKEINRRMVLETMA